MNTTTKNRIKAVGFILLFCIVLFGIVFDLYFQSYAGAMLKLLMLIPAIINRKALIEKYYLKNMA